MPSSDQKDRLIVALDVETFEEARQLIDQLSLHVNIYKVGSQLFTSVGPIAVRYLLSLGKKVFLDLKFHDIPNTVANAVSAATGMHAGQDKNSAGNSIFMYTVHTLGGKAMLEAAVAAAIKKAKELNIPKPLGLGITVLTSDGQTPHTTSTVLERALLAKEAGLDGVVASVQEAQILRQKLGREFIIVTPGIRPQGSEVGDQQRIASPSEAIQNGSDYLVVGRPIVKAANPSDAAQKTLAEIREARRP